MNVIAINLPKCYITAIQDLMDLGVYPSRSEAIRVALSDFLEDEARMYEELTSEKFEVFIRSSLKQSGGSQ